MKASPGGLISLFSHKVHSFFESFAESGTRRGDSGISENDVQHRQRWGRAARVAKVSNPTFSCTPSAGYTLMETYLLGPSGEHIKELGQGGTFLRSNV
jgi:hypothetical protein